MPKKRFPVMIDEELFRKVKVHCATMGISIKAFVEYSLEKELIRIESKREKKA